MLLRDRKKELMPERCSYVHNPRILVSQERQEDTLVHDWWMFTSILPV